MCIHVYICVHVYVSVCVLCHPPCSGHGDMSLAYVKVWLMTAPYTLLCGGDQAEPVVPRVDLANQQ